MAHIPTGRPGAAGPPDLQEDLARLGRAAAGVLVPAGRRLGRAAACLLVRLGRRGGAEKVEETDKALTQPKF